MNGEKYDVIAKQKLPVILVVDTSSSMRGKRIARVNSAIADIKDYLSRLNGETSEVDFYVSVLAFGTSAEFLEWGDNRHISEFNPLPITAGGYSNLHLAYEKLGDVLKKESSGGSMPDFGGVAPIIMLITDGHPSKSTKSELAKLKKLPWFNASIRYGIAIELDDDKTMATLTDFTDDSSSVINCVNSDNLAKLIKIIVLTASKVKSQSSAVNNKKNREVKNAVKQLIQSSLDGFEDLEW